MKITSVNHAALNIPAGMAEVRHFYTQLLGIPTVPRQLPAEFADKVPGFWMQLGQTQVHIIQAPLEGRAREPLGPHIAFYVDDLDAAVEELETARVAFDRLGGFVFFSDPAGNTIELQQDPERVPD
jgi:catechol 2,3-dioxygenase-like lactoylglutathione lyase family enzyme